MLSRYTAFIMGVVSVVVGIFLIIVGLAGLVLPLIPGILCIVLGFYLITFNDPVANAKIRSRLSATPILLEFFDVFDARFRKWFSKGKRKP